MIPSLEALADAMLISATDRYFAKALGRVGGEARPLVLAAIALASRETLRGNTCLSLQHLAQAETWGEFASEFEIPETEVWQQALASSSLVAAPSPEPAALSAEGEAFGDARPMVLDGAGRLYLRRYWAFQQQLADQLHQRAALEATELDLAKLSASLERTFKTDEERDQRLAAELAVRRKFAVISGGPGTGKTATAGKILALIVEQSLCQDAAGRARLPRIALVAPTGKAAANLARSIQRVVDQLECAPEIKRAIPTAAQTIHRYLGVRDRALPGFRQHADNPLPIDLLLVDEASMVDLALMTRLLSAVPKQARVILLGDEHQLASVETGAVLGDICALGLAEGHSSKARQNPLASCIARLTHSYRYDSKSGIGALARAIQQGDGAAALEVLDSKKHPEVSRFEFDVRHAGGAPFHRDVAEGFGCYLAEQDPLQRLSSFSHFRVLSPQRRGLGGVEELNRSIEAILRREKQIDIRGTRYPGRPLLINTNDYGLQLFNGDVGIVLPGEAGAERVLFHSESGAPRRIAYSRLPQHETSFAMTVHKSQGAEFDEVAIVLTDFAAERASRELLYTAVTRARNKVTLYASRSAIEATLARKLERTSGLGDALRSRASRRAPVEVRSPNLR